MTLGSYLEDLGDEQKPLSHLGLLQFSGLSPEGVSEFKAAWAGLTADRKCQVLQRLTELSEDNIELDYAPIFRAALADGGADVRERATRGLWDCEDRVIVRPLIGLLKNDPSPGVRATAATSLGKFAEMAQQGKLLPRDANRIKEALLAVLDREDEDVEVTRRTIESVASFDSPEIEQIIRTAYDSSDARVKQSAIYAMGRSSDGQWLPTVVREAHHEDPAIRYEAASACGQLGDESTIPYIIRLITDEDAHVQLSAVRALAAIGGPLAKRALRQCVKDGDGALEEAAQLALDAIGLQEDPLDVRFVS